MGGGPAQLGEPEVDVDGKGDRGAGGGGGSGSCQGGLLKVC